MKKSKTFLAFMISFLAGVLCVSLFWVGKEITAFIVFLLFVIAFGKVLFSFDKWMVLIAIIGLLFGVSRFLFFERFTENDIRNFSGKVELTACISEEPDVRKDKVKYVVNVDSLVLKEETVLSEGKILINSLKYPAYEYGDCLEVIGDLQTPSVVGDFAYDDYLARYQIYKILYQPKMQKLDFSKKNPLFAKIFSLKKAFEGKIEQVFSEPHAGLMAGLILGSRQGISEQLTADFKTTGLSHIVAISGYNVTMVILIVGGLLGGLQKKTKIVFSIVFICLFVILVGAGPAVIRAGIMSTISLMSLWFGRQYWVKTALIFSAFFMNLFNPLILYFDAGFQLSFLATAGLVYVSPYLEKYFQWVPDSLMLRESVLMTLSAQALALPIIMMNFGNLSLISPLANLFVLPFIPYAMLFGFAAAALGFLSSFLAMIPGFIGYIFLQIIIFFVETFANFPLAAVAIDYFPWWITALYYFFIVRRFSLPSSPSSSSFPP